MSAVEEIEAAITFLTELRTESTAGEWRTVVTSGDHWYLHSREEEEMVASITTNDGDNEARREPNAELIAALHRTIDAQLSLLDWGMSIYRIPNLDIPSPLETRVLALARSISGTS